MTRINKPQSISHPPSVAERKQIDCILNEFTATVQSADCLGETTKWHEYLSDARISFFYEVLQILKDRNIPLDGMKVIDFGSGSGYLLRLIQQSGSPTVMLGIDSFAQFNDLAKRICPSADFLQSADSVKQKFDVVFCTEVLEHLKHPQDCVRRLADMLRPNGRLVLTVPDGRTDTSSARKLREDESGYWGHVHFWSPESWPLFLSQSLGPTAELETGQVSSGENFAVIRVSET